MLENSATEKQSHAQENTQTKLTHLPLDLLCLIFSFLDKPKDIMNFAIVLMLDTSFYPSEDIDKLIKDEIKDESGNIIKKANMERIKFFEQLRDISKQPLAKEFFKLTQKFTFYQTIEKTVIKVTSSVQLKKQRSSIAAGGYFTYYIDKNHQVFSWGDKSFGQLGIGASDERKISPRIVNINKGENEKFISVATGRDHTLILSDAGKIWSTGNNGNGQLGIGNLNTKSQFIEINLQEITFTCIAAGWVHSLALTDTGEVYGFGSNESGQLGQGEKINLKNVPTHIAGLAGKNVVRISVGQCHSMALCKNGDVYVWGYNSYGQLGLGDTKLRDTPELLSFEGLLLPGERIVEFACGIGNSSFFLTNKGRVFCCGRNDVHQLGIPDNTNSVKTPKLMEAFNSKKIVKINFGYRHGLALTDTGELYIWGSGDWMIPKQIKQPTPITHNLKNIVEIKCGFSHSIIKTEDGKIYTIGDNMYGELGLNHNESRDQNRLGEEAVTIPELLVSDESVKSDKANTLTLTLRK